MVEQIAATVADAKKNHRRRPLLAGGREGGVLASMRWVISHKRDDDEYEEERRLRKWYEKNPETFGRALMRMEEREYQGGRRAGRQAGQTEKMEGPAPEVIGADAGFERLEDVCLTWLEEHGADP